MNYKVYRMTNEPNGELGFANVCQTNYASIANFAVEQAASDLGSNLGVILISDGDLERVVRGKVAKA